MGWCEDKEVVVHGPDQRKLPSTDQSPEGVQASSEENATNARMEKCHCTHNARLYGQVGITTRAEVINANPFVFISTLVTRLR